MKQFNSHDTRKELEVRGLCCLTGEGDNLGIRLVTDVSPTAAPLIEEFFAMKLHQSGMNGWSKTPEGVYVPGQLQAWTYDEENRYVKKEGWETKDGFCFHLPGVLVKDLLIFLILRQGAWSIVRLMSQGNPGMRQDDLFFVLDSDEEHHEFMENFQAEDNFDDLPNNVGVAETAKFAARQVRAKLYNWNSWLSSRAVTNQHQFSGRTLV